LNQTQTRSYEKIILHFGSNGRLWRSVRAEIGKPAPDFTGKDINGQTHKLSDYKGKIVVLESYNLDCPFCHNHFETGAMQELQAEMTGKGVVWLMVNSTNPKHPSYRNPAAAKKEWADEKIKATAWLDDSSGQIGKLYGIENHAPHVCHQQGWRAGLSRRDR